mgnify:CR=1 FL=1
MYPLLYWGVPHFLTERARCRAESCAGWGRVLECLLDRIHEADCVNGYVLDGFPRTIPQAESLTKALSERGEAVDYAVNVDVPDENIINRMSGRVHA